MRKVKTKKYCAVSKNHCKNVTEKRFIFSQKKKKAVSLKDNYHLKLTDVSNEKLSFKGKDQENFLGN